MIPGYIQRITDRNLYYIRCQTVSALGMVFNSMKFFDFKIWLENSAPALLQAFTSSDFGSDYYLGHGDEDASTVDNYTTVLSMCLSAHEDSCGRSDDDMKNYSDFMWRNISRSNGIADDNFMYEMHQDANIEDFILSGAIMHTLCTLEEFERGLLRILFLYGIQPKVEDSTRKLLHPNLKDFRKSSPEWEEAENSKWVYSISGRHSVLESYSVNAEPDTDWNDRLWSIRTDRNTIARAVATLRHPFQSFLQLHYDAYRAVRYLADETVSAQRIAL
jgi:hypothetical protein